MVLRADTRAPEFDEPPRRNMTLAVAVTIAVMAASASCVWAAWRILSHGNASATVPIIHADERPVKVPPANPGGMRVPDQNLYVLNGAKPADNHVEQLLPPPEAPLPRPTPPQAVTPAPQDALAAGAASAPSPAPQASPSVVNAMPNVAAPAGNDVQAASPPFAAPSANAASTLTPPAANTLPTPAASPQTNPQVATIAPPIVAVPPAAVKAAPAPPPVAALPPAAAAPAVLTTAASGYRLQVGAVRSVAEAQAEWTRLKHAQPDLLGHLDAASVRTDLGERGIFFRIVAGPVGDQATAERACTELKERKVGCILVKP